MIVIGGESPIEFEALRAEFVDEFQPQTVVESELVERLAGIAWRIRRIPRFEAGLIEARHSESGGNPSPGDPALFEKHYRQLAKRFMRPEALKELEEEGIGGRGGTAREDEG